LHITGPILLFGGHVELLQPHSKRVLQMMDNNNNKSFQHAVRHKLVTRLIYRANEKAAQPKRADVANILFINERNNNEKARNQLDGNYTLPTSKSLILVPLIIFIVSSPLFIVQQYMGPTICSDRVFE
jgi:hypothetical protein